MGHELEINADGTARAFYGSGQPAWHNLGTVVAGQPNSEEAMKLAQLDSWNIEKQPLYIPNPDGSGDYIVAEGQVAIVRRQDEKILGYATPRFEETQNEEAFAFMDALVGEGCKYEAAGSLFGGQRVWALAAMPEDIKIAGDDVREYIFMSWGHDGHHAITLSDTPTRVVCWNTMKMALGEAKDRLWKIKHLGNMGTKLQEAGEAMKFMHLRSKVLKDKADELLQIKVSEKRAGKLLLSLFPDGDRLSDLVKKRNEEKRGHLYRALQMEDLENFRQTGWGFVCAVADYTSHHVPEKKIDNEKWRQNNLVSVMKGHSLLEKATELVLASK